MTSEALWDATEPRRVPQPPAAIGAALSISTVSVQTGINLATLRIWQTRYGLGPSLTTPGGHRRYTAGDIQRLRRVKHLVSEGLTTSEAVHAVLGAARSDLGLPLDADPVAHHLGAAALELDGPTTRRLIDEHLRRGDVAATWENVLRPVLSAVGDRWSKLSYGIAVEHLLSRIAADLLSDRNEYHGAGNAATVHTPTAAAQSVVLACVPGELHDLPLAVLDAALHSAGIAVTRLAAPTAEAALDDAVTRHHRPMIALHAMSQGPADPALFDHYPAVTTLLALGPGWQPDDLPTRVAHVNTVAAAQEHIDSFIRARRQMRTG